MMRNPVSARACACAEDDSGGAEAAVVDELETWEYIEDVDACLEWPPGVETSLYGFDMGPLGMLLAVVCVGLGWRSVSVGERAWLVELSILGFPLPWFGRGCVTSPDIIASSLRWAAISAAYGYILATAGLTADGRCRARMRTTLIVSAHPMRRVESSCQNREHLNRSARGLSDVLSIVANRAWS